LEKQDKQVDGQLLQYLVGVVENIVPELQLHKLLVIAAPGTQELQNDPF
jgi:hypothetical protein